ncbi:MAG: RiPP maturation radical SAM C-methyltransferase [Holophagales bacterium]|nr:RiPP maturation radical SAM C-methyltransferase [Holophagales bacterium]
MSRGVDRAPGAAETGGREVHLVVPPYAPLEHPSLALGLLKAGLVERGMSATVSYLNLAFANEIGLGRYAYLGSTGALALLGEWSFAGAAFPEASADQDGYFELTERLLAGRYGAREALRSARVLLEDDDWRRALLETRTLAGGFIDRMARGILAGRPRIVGCSSTFQQHVASLALLRRIRELAPEVITVLGGANCDGPMGRANFESFPWLDVVVSGEADLLFPDLCSQLLSGGLPLPAMALSAGVLARGSEGGGRATVIDLDRVPMPDVDEYYQQLGDLPIGRYIVPAMLVETSRGCWWGAQKHCTFCGLNGTGMAYRSKSAERVLSELDALAGRYGRHMAAVDNILDMRYFKTVLPALAEREEPLELFFEIKANLKRDHMVRLAAAGVRVVQPGLESLHDVPLAQMLKGNDVATNLQLLKWARELGIAVTWFILSGLPVDEDWWYAEMADLVPRLTHLPPPLSLNQLEWHRFSPYHHQAAELGLELRPARSYRHVYPLPESTLANLAYAFERISPPAPGEEPGKNRLRQAIKDWQQAWASSPPELRREETADGLRVIDTRPGVESPERRLRGLDAEVCRATETARSRAGLLRLLRQRMTTDLTWSDLEPRLEELQAAGLVVEVSSRYLGLATGPPAGLGSRSAFGFSDVFAYLADRRSDRIGESGATRELPLRALFANNEGVDDDLSPARIAIEE